MLLTAAVAQQLCCFHSHNPHTSHTWTCTCQNPRRCTPAHRSPAWFQPNSFFKLFLPFHSLLQPSELTYHLAAQRAAMVAQGRWQDKCMLRALVSASTDRCVVFTTNWHTYAASILRLELSNTLVRVYGAVAMKRRLNSPQTEYRLHVTLQCIATRAGSCARQRQVNRHAG
jgi:hypothetical protein